MWNCVLLRFPPIDLSSFSGSSVLIFALRLGVLIIAIYSSPELHFCFIFYTFSISLNYDISTSFSSCVWIPPSLPALTLGQAARTSYSSVCWWWAWANLSAYHFVSCFRLEPMRWCLAIWKDEYTCNTMIEVYYDYLCNACATPHERGKGDRPFSYPWGGMICIFALDDNILKKNLCHRNAIFSHHSSPNSQQ